MRFFLTFSVCLFLFWGCKRNDVGSTALVVGSRFEVVSGVPSEVFRKRFGSAKSFEDRHFATLSHTADSTTVVYSLKGKADGVVYGFGSTFKMLRLQSERVYVVRGKLENLTPDFMPNATVEGSVRLNGNVLEVRLNAPFGGDWSSIVNADLVGLSN